MTIPVFIIAEGGVNHNGDVRLAHRLIDAAADAGADAIKFQTFIAESVVTPDAPLAEYQTRSYSGGQLDMIRALELPLQSHAELKEHAIERSIEFMSTAFDNECLRFLVEDVGILRVKIPSGELTNAPFVMRCARYGLPIILSTGMATLAEVKRACEVIAYAISTDRDPARIEDVNGILDDNELARLIKERVTVLHCTTAYPTPPEDVNLLAMLSMRRALNVDVGYSDHTIGNEVSIAATALGAVVLEKHLTLDRAMSGPDHRASSEPDDFATLVQQVRVISTALGHGAKAPSPAEIGHLVTSRRYLVASRPIPAGLVLTPDDIAVLRHGEGLAPDQYWTVLGSTAGRDYRAFEPLDPP